MIGSNLWHILSQCVAELSNSKFTLYKHDFLISKWEANIIMLRLCVVPATDCVVQPIISLNFKSPIRNSFASEVKTRIETSDCNDTMAMREIANIRRIILTVVTRATSMNFLGRHSPRGIRELPILYGLDKTLFEWKYSQFGLTRQVIGVRTTQQSHQYL